MGAQGDGELFLTFRLGGKKIVWEVIFSPIITSASSVIMTSAIQLRFPIIHSGASLELVLSSPSGNSYYSRTAQVRLLKLNYTGSQHHVKIGFV